MGKIQTSNSCELTPCGRDPLSRHVLQCFAQHGCCPAALDLGRHRTGVGIGFDYRRVESLVKGDARTPEPGAFCVQAVELCEAVRTYCPRRILTSDRVRDQQPYCTRQPVDVLLSGGWDLFGERDLSLDDAAAGGFDEAGDQLPADSVECGISWGYCCAVDGENDLGSAQGQTAGEGVAAHATLTDQARAAQFVEGRRHQTTAGHTALLKCFPDDGTAFGHGAHEDDPFVPLGLAPHS
ncbi:hypothetical protein [Streptomyces harbinensis]